MCFEPEDDKEDVAGAADEEPVGITEVDAVVADDGADSSWEYSDALSKSITDITSVIQLDDPDSKFDNQ